MCSQPSYSYRSEQNRHLFGGSPAEIHCDLVDDNPGAIYIPVGTLGGKAYATCDNGHNIMVVGIIEHVAAFGWSRARIVICPYASVCRVQAVCTVVGLD